VVHFYAAAPIHNQTAVDSLPRLQPDEVPIIARRGEEIVTEHDPRHRRNVGRHQATVIIEAPMTVVTPDVDGFRASQGQLAAEYARLLEQAGRNL
jgi:hypothetical protein